MPPSGRGQPLSHLSSRLASPSAEPATGPTRAARGSPRAEPDRDGDLSFVRRLAELSGPLRARDQLDLPASAPEPAGEGQGRPEAGRVGRPDQDVDSPEPEGRHFGVLVGQDRQGRMSRMEVRRRLPAR